MKKKISGVYRITNTVTGDFYIGSSIDVKQRWKSHKSPSTWKNKPNSLLYKDMKKYGLDSFEFQVIIEVKPESLKETEQQFIETLQPTYNIRRSNIWGFENKKECQKEYEKKYKNQLCCFNGQTLSLNALSTRFRSQGISHPTIEAKKYLIRR